MGIFTNSNSSNVVSSNTSKEVESSNNEDLRRLLIQLEYEKSLLETGLLGSSMQNYVTNLKERAKNDYKKSSVYNKVLTKIVHTAINNLPADLSSIIPDTFLLLLSQALIKMRKNGYAFIVKTTSSVIDTDINSYKLLDLDFSFNESTNNYNFKYNNTDISINNIIVLGSLDDKNYAKFDCNDNLKNSITDYEIISILYYIRNANNGALIIKNDNEVEHQKNLKNNTQNQNIEKFKNRVAGSALFLDFKQDIAFFSEDLSSALDAVQEAKKRICFDADIPFTILFGESETGLNATGEDTRVNWYDSVHAFQKIYLVPALKIIAKWLHKESEFNSIKFDKFEAEDKLKTSQIRAQEIENIIFAASNGAITENEKRVLLRKVFNLTNME